MMSKLVSSETGNIQTCKIFVCWKWVPCHEGTNGHSIYDRRHS